MKEFLHNFLPYRKLSFIKGSILLIALAIWSIIQFPYFENMGERRFFSYDWNYFSVYLHPGMLNALINDFLSQLSSWPWAIMTGYYLLSVLFLVCAYRSGGRYAVFMMPFWLILSCSLSNAEQDFAIEMMAGLIALSIFLAWITYREEKAQSAFFYETFYLRYWLYYVGVGFALLYLNGASILLFYGSVVLYRFFILIFSLSNKGKENLDTAVMAFGIYFITGAGICLTFPRAFEFPAFMSGWGWEKWTALTLFVAAIAANLYRSSHKRNLDKPVTSTWPFLISGLLISGLMVAKNDSPEKRHFVKADNAIERNDYSCSYQACHDFFKKYPVPDRHIRSTEKILRANLGLRLKLSLLMDNRLLDDFFKYRHIPEMQGMIPDMIPYTDPHSFAYAKLYQETGLFGSVIPILEYTLENYYHQIRMLRILLPIEIECRQYTLAEKIIPMMEKSIGNRQFTKENKKKLQDFLNQNMSENPSPVGTGLTLNLAHLKADYLISRKVEDLLLEENKKRIGWENDRLILNARRLNESTPINKAALDYYTLVCLLNGKLENLPIITAEYRKLGISELPDYLQEGLALWMNIKDTNTLTDDHSSFMGYPLQKKNTELCDKIRTEMQNGKSKEELDRLYGDTYTLHYYLNINPPELPYQEGGSYCI